MARDAPQRDPVRQPANPVAGRARSARSQTRHRSVHRAPHPDNNTTQPAVVRRPRDRPASPSVRAPPSWVAGARSRGPEEERIGPVGLAPHRPSPVVVPSRARFLSAGCSPIRPLSSSAATARREVLSGTGCHVRHDSGCRRCSIRVRLGPRLPPPVDMWGGPVRSGRRRTPRQTQPRDSTSAPGASPGVVPRGRQAGPSWPGGDCSRARRTPPEQPASRWLLVSRSTCFYSKSEPSIVNGLSAKSACDLRPWPAPHPGGRVPSTPTLSSTHTGGCPPGAESGPCRLA